MTPMIFAMQGNEPMAAKISQLRGWELGSWENRRFPDGESFVRYLSEIKGRDIAIVCSLDRPDDKSIALYLAACVARELGARQIGLVAPYLAYMRQDTRFHAGEGITAKHFARLLSGACDWLVTVDPHLHRIHSLDEVYQVPTRLVHAAPHLAGWIRSHVPRPLLVGPDAESEQWVSEVAGVIGCPFTLLKKTRYGDSDVVVTVPGIDRWRDCTPVLVDDIASTARTMMAGVARLHEAGMAAPVCVAVHALFAGTAYADLLASGIAGVVSTNTVSHPSNQIDIAESVAAAMDILFSGTSDKTVA